VTPAGLLAVAVACAVAAGLRAQVEPPAGGPVPPFGDQWNSLQSIDRDDYREWHFLGGFRLAMPSLRLSIRGENALLLTDLEETRALAQTAGDGPVRRGIELPAPRRRLSPDELRERMLRSLRAVGRADPARVADVGDRALDVPRYLYCEGGVVVVRDGLEVLRCDRLWISPLDDRIVVENAELRYTTTTGGGGDTLLVRGPRLVKQGPRWTGREVTLTTCSAAEPHVALAIGEVEILERDGEFEVIARGQALQVGGTNLLPLPDAHVFTGSQGQFPIRSVRAGWSGKEGAEAGIVFGLPWNGAGGSLHRWLTGRPAHEFRGDWELGVGWIQERGAPLDGVLDYRVPGLYAGRTEAFWIDDRGPDLREITTNLDGSAIARGNRGLVRTQNRFEFGPNTRFDVVAFHASDPAVWSEFHRGPYRNEETPETSTYLHHADGNRLLTVGSRFNLSEFSYRDDRALAQRFVEELPVVTYHWIAQPIATTPWQTPVVVDFATELGQRRSDYDDRAGMRISDRTFRADQHAEVSAPFRLGPLNVRPFASGRGTFYDHAVDGESEGRFAATGGVQFGTRMARTWSWLADGESRALRHVLAPRVSWINRFRVDDDAGEFVQFDAVDSLGEEELVRVELRNLLQTAGGDDVASRQPHEVVMLDLAQDFFPRRARDNAGEDLGLFRYDLLLRPEPGALPVDDFAFALYGDHDWEDGLRTLDAELRFGPLAGIAWTVEYRTDRLVDGAVGIGANTALLDRWDLFAASQRDIDGDEWLSWSFGLRRNDHDWAIELSAVYDPFADETTLRLDFLPRLGSFNAPRGSRFGGYRGPDPFATGY
jgi:hypothetical protein